MFLMQGQNLEVYTCMTGINFSHQDCHQITSNTCNKDTCTSNTCSKDTCTSNTCTTGTYSPESPRSNIPSCVQVFWRKVEILNIFFYDWAHALHVVGYYFFSSIAHDNYTTNPNISTWNLLYIYTVVCITVVLVALYNLWSMTCRCVVVFLQ